MEVGRLAQQGGAVFTPAQGGLAVPGVPGGSIIAMAPENRSRKAYVYPNRVLPRRKAVPSPSQPAVQTAPVRYHVRYSASFQPEALAMASAPAAIP